jgi:heme/copper-type cytochrome/quinol oxidase subunit 2
MFLLGLLPLAVWMVHGTKYYGDQVKRFGTIALALTTLTMALGTVGLATIANDFTLGDFFTGIKIWMAAWCGLVFFFSMLGFSAWWSRRLPLNLPGLPQMIGTLAALLIATEGVILIGFSGEAQLDTIGTLSKTMTMLISVQVLVLGMLATVAWLFRQEKWFQGNFNRMLIDMLVLIVLTVVSLEGVAIMALAAPITIEGIGTMLESTMQMFGLQLTALAMLTLLCWIFREDGSLPKMQRFMFVVLIFLALLIPPALLL